MAEDWKVSFKKALIDALIKNGDLMKPDETYRYYGGWRFHGRDAENMCRIIETGEIDYEASTWQESEWDEFMGTFYEGDTRVKGIDVRVVMKTKEEFNWRWEGTVSDLIQQVLVEAAR